jgi:hypothetical protein
MKQTTQELRKMVIEFTKEELESEIWLPIKGFEDYYEVSSLGRFRNKDRLLTRSNGIKQFTKSKILKNNYYSNGYVQLILYVDSVRFNFLGHRVVAEHFVNNPENLPIVNHLNLKKWDNRISNIEWCTKSENGLHAYINGCFDNVKKVKGEQHSNTNLTNEDVRYIRANYKKGKNNDNLYKLFSDKVGRAGFDKICYGVGWDSV